ncbi:uncharacterized protein LOC120335253 [Styela clava]|uniref:uncharacterized protein LOC120335253 n=1 Tax=Styela clava TaxID=7725 RepID=UPI0019397D77|nr:uncharacterized protein LOC120335253 [Styela clava]XP_039260154.1 uncharacterized protein LOC120336528 [Styela clava]
MGGLIYFIVAGCLCCICCNYLFKMKNRVRDSEDIHRVENGRISTDSIVHVENITRSQTDLQQNLEMSSNYLDLPPSYDDVMKSIRDDSHETSSSVAEEMSTEESVKMENADPAVFNPHRPDSSTIANNQNGNCVTSL